MLVLSVLQPLFHFHVVATIGSLLLALLVMLTELASRCGLEVFVLPSIVVSVTEDSEMSLSAPLYRGTGAATAVEMPRSARSTARSRARRIKRIVIGPVVPLKIYL